MGGINDAGLGDVTSTPSDTGTQDRIACVGASAGGVEALQRLFSNVPKNMGIGFVVLQHLAPDHESLLAELLGRSSNISVEYATDGVRVAPNHVFVIPPNSLATIEHGCLRLVLAKTPHGHHQIDELMRSLAEDQAQNAIGIVLSGTGEDGTEGLGFIRARGGLTIAQTPSDAQFDGMPNSAVASGQVDYVLPVAGIIELLESYVNRRPLERKDDTDETNVKFEEGLELLFSRLREIAGPDFRQYKRNTIVRRIRRRMDMRQIDTIQEYAELALQQTSEIEQLAKDLLISVTQFFRDKEVFEELERKLASIVSQQVGRPSAGIRIWVVGCATGEEAYSLGILIREQMSKFAFFGCQIFATDIDEHALNTARRGVYSAKIADEVGAERIRRHFVKNEDGSFRVSKELREMCIFSTHDILRDPPFSRVDLISCRNVFIYLDNEAQKKILPIFHYALRPTGTLLLGPSEGVNGRMDLFSPIDKKSRLFVRNEVVPAPNIIFPSTSSGPVQRGFDRMQLTQPTIPLRQQLGDTFRRVLLDEFAPAAALVSNQGEILHLSGRAREFLELAAGPFDNNIIAMTHPALRLELRTALHKAMRGGSTTMTQTIAVQRYQLMIDTRVIVRPLSHQTLDTPLFLIVFEELGRNPSPPEVPLPVSNAALQGTLIQDLEADLRRTREELEATIMELEASNDELKSSNEELMSMNEEMQSANEELQTSKEEGQSINEELQTLNAELGKRIEEINRTNDDLQNLLRGTPIATIFLDSDLRIKRYTPATAQIFHLIETDVGRPITDISSPFNDSGWIDDVRHVASTLAPRQRSLRSEVSDAWYMMLVLPYRTIANLIDGVVVTFINVTELKRAQLRAAELASIVESSQDAIVGQTLDGTITSWNRGAELLYGYDGTEMIGRNASVLVDESRRSEIDSLRATLNANIVPRPIETQHLRKNGTSVDISLAFSPLSDETGRRTGLAAIARDVSLRKQFERDTEKLRAEVDHNLRDIRVILDVVPVGITIAHDSGAQNITGNAACTRLLGVARDTNLSPLAPDADRILPFRLRRAGTDVPASELATVRTASRGVVVHAEPYEVIFRDGSIKHIVISSVPLLDNEGRPRGAVTVFTDVTTERRTALELEETSRHKDEFLAMLGHELRNPLAAMMSALMLMERTKSPEKTARAMAVIDRQIRHLVRLVDDLLDLSRVSRGKIDLQREPLDFVDLARAVVEDHQAACQERGIILEFHVVNTPLMMLGDRVRLSQVIGNLLSNAAKFTNPGGRVTVTVSEQSAMAVLNVTDTGVGIDPLALTSIFGMFVQADSSQPRARTGLGLGLAVCKRLVEMHGGSIEAQSDGSGHGSTFIVRLPLSRASTPSMPTDELNGPSEHRHRRILLIEDNEEIVLTLRALLEMSGHSVESALDGPTGLEAAARFLPDVILCDIGLPGTMDGYAVARAIRTDPKLREMTLIAVTGYAREEDRQQALHSGFDAHVGKPIDVDNLETLLRKARAQRQR